jgi:hypothetical protein
MKSAIQCTNTCSTGMSACDGVGQADEQNTTAGDTGVAGTGGANFGQSTNQA